MRLAISVASIDLLSPHKMAGIKLSAWQRRGSESENYEYHGIIYDMGMA